MNRSRKFVTGLGVLLVVIGIGLFVTLRYIDSPKRGTPFVFSNNAMLLELWNNYKANNIEASSSRTIDRSQKNLTTSEGQSYTMLRSVWMDDKTTFDKSWQFTQNNLQRSDKLFSWKFGQRTDGSYGILTDQGGQNTAADADSDIALSLMMAYSRWNEPAYLYQAKQIVNSIWEQEVILIQGKPVLTADNLERNAATNVVVNPSYFAPYSFKLFATLDPDHDWKGLSDNSYALLTKLGSDPLGSSKSSGLPPNWITMNRQTGAFIPNASPNLNTNYGYDAFRIPWRLAVDYTWYKDPRAKQLLSTYSFLGQQWRESGSLKTEYAHDGTVLGNYESPAAYGGSMGYFTVADTSVSKAVYARKLERLYDPDKQQWKTKLSYYDDNWAWFGIALYQKSLPNLATNNH